MSGPAGQAGTPQQRAGLRLAFLGPAGTFSEEAALKYDAQAESVPMASITAVASAVDSGMADLGIVPIENSLEELWSMFEFLMPGLLGRVDDFRARFRQAFQQLGQLLACHLKDPAKKCRSRTAWRG